MKYVCESRNCFTCPWGKDCDDYKTSITYACTGYCDWCELYDRCHRPVNDNIKEAFESITKNMGIENYLNSEEE